MKHREKTALFTVITFAVVVCLIYFAASVKGKTALDDKSDTSNDVVYSSYGYDAVSVECLNGDIEIFAGDYKDIYYEQNGTSENIQGRVDENTLYISSSPQASGTLSVYIPKNYFGVNSGKLTVKSVSADIKIEDISVKQLKIDVASGDIELNNVYIYEASLSSRSGDIDIDDSAIEIVNADVSNGNLKAASEFGEMYISVLKGNAVLDCETDVKRADVTVTSGNLKLKLTNKDISFYIENYSGGFTCNRDLSFDGKCYNLGSGNVPLSLINYNGDINISID